LGKGRLNLDLLGRQLEYAVLVDLVADLAEEVGDLAGGRCGSAVCLFRLLR